MIGKSSCGLDDESGSSGSNSGSNSGSSCALLGVGPGKEGPGSGEESRSSVDGGFSPFFCESNAAPVSFIHRGSGSGVETFSHIYLSGRRE